MSLTTDKNNPDLSKGEVNEITKQNKVYLVLSDEEKAKGFIRPVRNSYVHVGRYYEHEPVLLKEPKEFKDIVYVATIPSLVKDGKVIGSAYITQKEFDQYNVNKPVQVELIRL